MAVDSNYAGTYAPDPQITEAEDRDSSNQYDLGQPAKEVYDTLAKSTRREEILRQARALAELTIPSVMPPEGWDEGEELPGNNQSVGASCVSTLASKLMFAAFPPGQPIMRLDPREEDLQKEIDANPQVWALIELSMSRLELVHRKKAAVVGLATSWVGALEQLLVAGNVLWKHITISAPTWHRMDSYVVQRAGDGHPIVTIHREVKRLVTLSKADQALIMSEWDDKERSDMQKEPEWEREADIYSVCRIKRGDDDSSDPEDWSWEYWQETAKGTLLEGSEVETDYDDCPMWPCWLRPNFGGDWGLSYCEKYKGDLYTVEAGHSGLNDGMALATWLLGFVKPGSRTSIKSVREAANLSFLSGSGEDITFPEMNKSGDLGWASQHIERAERRLGVAFLSEAAARREGERVTADEVQRVGMELDKAMGGLYTQSAQGNQRRMIMRFIKLHQESSPKLPKLPEGIVDVQVVTGVDAMGRQSDVSALLDFSKAMQSTFPQTPNSGMDPEGFGTRLAAGLGVKPEGLLMTAADQQQQQDKQKQDLMQHTLLDKAAGPVAGEMAKAGAAHLMPGAQGPAGQGDNQPPTQAAPTDGGPDGGQ